MTGPQAPSTIAKTFVELADTLVADFDLVEFLHLLTVRCQRDLGVPAVGLLLADNHGGLNVMAASSHQVRVLELFQLQNAEGPCLDCYRTARAVSCPDLATASDRWPRFSRKALDAGFAAVHALPMRLRNEVIGGLNLFTATTGGLDDELLALGQAMADVATIGLLQERAARERELLVEQLQNVVNRRLAVEQAKGVLAERVGVTIGEAFELLVAYARRNQLKLLDVAHAVADNDPRVAELADPRSGGSPGSAP
jgi:ANTAR domain/GAF domain